MLALTAQIVAIALGICNEGSTSACTLANCLKAVRTCESGRVGPCTCIQYPPSLQNFALLSPPSGASIAGSTPTLAWARSGDATGYRVDVYRPGQSTAIYSTTTALTSLQLPPNVLAPSTSYEWGVTSLLSGQSLPSTPTRFSFSTLAAPVAKLDWSMARRYGAAVQPSGVLVPTPLYPVGGFRVDLDACASLPGFSTVTNYLFSTNLGTAVPVSAAGCNASLIVPNGTNFTASVTLVDSAGRTSSATVNAQSRDILIVAVGDSYASGEGNPDASISQGGPIWEDDACHRSQYSPAALAAREIEDSDPKSSVTFLSRACTGGRTVDLLDEQLPSIASSLTPPSPAVPARHVDMFFIGIGGNDVGFGTVIGHCLTDSCGGSYLIKKLIREGSYSLPSSLDEVIASIRALAPSVDDTTKLVLTEYPDPTRSSVDTYCKMLSFFETAIPPILEHDVVVWPSESSFISANFATPLNKLVLSAAARNRIYYGAGTWDASIAHGYCAGARWVNTYTDSLTTQGPDDDWHGISSASIDIPLLLTEEYAYTKGTLHPNRGGAQNIASNALAAMADLPGAVYDSIIGAPICAHPGPGCSAGPELLGGQASTEPHTPNALFGIQETLGRASIDALSVSAGAGHLAEGGPVTISVTTTQTGSPLPVLLYSTARALEGGNSGAPVWTYVGTLSPSQSGQATYSLSMSLPQGSLQAVRASIRDGSANVDTDDLVFMVESSETCPGSWLKCGPSCTFDDPAHCGSCDVACASTFICSAGTCACPEGLTVCDGACTPLGTDTNCAFCDDNCASQGMVCLYLTTGDWPGYMCLPPNQN